MNLGFALRYIRFIGKKWKVATFVVATFLLYLFGKFAGDPTWDIYSVLIMSVFTFLFAPFTVGVFAQGLIYRKIDLRIVLAFVFWITTVVLTYEAYVYFKFGIWGEAALENFFISSAFFFLAGLFWNLSADVKSSYFSFINSNWPQSDPRVPWRPLIIIGIPISATYIAILIGLIYAK